jgi:hypothetical protein
MPWRGMTTQTNADGGDRRLALIEGGYVNADGTEIRMMPGLRTAFDFASLGRADGYRVNVIDSGRPPSAASGNYRIQNDQAAITESQKVWSREALMHCVEMVNGQPIVIGESEFVREPIQTAGGAECFLVSWTNAAHTVLTLSAAPNITASDGTATGRFNSVSPAVLGVGIASIIYIESDCGGELAGQLHEVRSCTGSTITLQTPTSTAGNFTGSLTISRVRPQGGSVNPYPKLPTRDSQVAYGEGEPFDDPESLTAYRATSAGDPDGAIVTACNPAFVANRMRDHSDTVGEVVEGYETAYWRSRRRRSSLPYRVNPSVASDRLLLAAPGYGCAFQVPAILPHDTTNTYLLQDFFRPRCAGVPKAVMFEDVNTTAVAGSWHVTGSAAAGTDYGGTATPGPAGVYKVTCCYRDDVTGEMGIAADPITITTDAVTGVHQGLRIGILFPGYLMAETAALSILVFRSDKGGSVLKYQQTISPETALLVPAQTSGRYGLPVNAIGTNMDLYLSFNFPAIADTDLNAAIGPPDGLVQMPMGCKDVYTIRGQTFYVGAYGNVGLRHERLSTATLLQYDNNVPSYYPDRDRIVMQFFNGTSPEPVNGWRWMLANGTLSPAYAGQEIGSDVAFFPYPRATATLDSLTNARSIADGAPVTPHYSVALWPRYKLLETGLRKGDPWNSSGAGSATASNQRNCFLRMPHGTYQVSLVDNPTQTPAINTGVADSELEGDDLEAVGAMRGGAMLLTRSAAYYLQWADDPSATTPGLLSREFGCIAANTLVEFDGGTCWISEHGPVASYGGAPVWIGQELQDLFIGAKARYLRDSEGMMRHAWACHDPERGLVYFGLFSNRNATQIVYRNANVSWAGATNQARSRFPCDEVLIWSYRANAWSVWYPPTGCEAQWFARWIDANGKPRIWMLGADKRIYCFDDTFADRNRKPVNLAITLLSNSATYTVGAGAFNDDFNSRKNLGGGSNAFVAVGMKVAITDSTQQVYKGQGTVQSYSVANHTITLDSAVAVVPGDFLLVGMRGMTVTTNFLNGQQQQPTQMSGVNLRYSLWSEYVFGAGVAQPAFGKVSDTVNKRLGRSDVTAPLNTDTVGDWRLLGTSYIQGLTQDQWFGEGKPSGQEHQIKVEMLGACQVRLQDLTVQIP